MNLRKIGRGLRKGLALVASVGPAILSIFGVKKGTAADKAVKVAEQVEKGVEIIEGAPPPSGG
jgi:hypothetical protein